MNDPGKTSPQSHAPGMRPGVSADTPNASPSPAMPLTIAAMQVSLRRAEFSPNEALRWQVRHLKDHKARYRCVVARHASDPNIATQGPLQGIGLAHKDIFATDDRFPGNGYNKPPPGRPGAGQGASVLQTLSKAGAANLAALTMAPFACGATAENQFGPQALNPVDPLAMLGGSSSGSAAAVAAGLCYASLGTDTAGSVRIPAASCGLLGLKPTWGAIPVDGVQPLAPSLDSVGVIARSAADAAAIFSLIRATRPDDALTHAAGNADALEAILLAPRQWRVRAAFDFPDLDDDVATVLAAFAGEVAQTMALQSVVVADLGDITRHAEAVLHAESAIVHHRRMHDAGDTLTRQMRAVLLPGVAMPEHWLRDALTRRPKIAARFARASLADADLLLLPALPHALPDCALVHTDSPQFDARRLLALPRFMSFVNYLGFPALVFPVGRDARGRPVCVQAIGLPHAEAVLLAFAYQHERKHYGHGGFPTPSIIHASVN